MFGGIPKSEIDELSDYWTAFPELKAALFTENGTPYVNISVEDIKKAIKTNADVVGFEKAFADAFSDLPVYLKQTLIDDVASVEINREEAAISENIFARLKNIPIINRYEAYQLLDDEWTRIAIDLEIIQTEGFEATKKVDPNIVLKKKDGKDQEVQEGWVGHIMPFSLVQATLLQADSTALAAKESRLAEIPAEYEEIADTLTEEEKEGDFFAEDSFVAKEVTKKIKELKADTSPEGIALKVKLDKVDSLMQEEKDLKAQIKKDSAALQAKTKSTIESLTDEQARTLLEKKWIETLVTKLSKLPDTLIDSLVTKLQALESKYKTTFFEVETQIQETEAQLATMIDSLDGNEFDLKGLSEFKSLLAGKE